MSRRKKWRIRSVAAVLISLPLLLSGCQKTESILAGMGGEKGYERPEIMIAAMSQKNTCEELCTGQIWSAQVDESGKTFEEYTKEQLKSFMDELKILTLLAKERNISLTEEEASAMAKASEEYLAALTPEDISYMGVDETSVNTMFHDYCLANKTVEELTKDLDMEVSDSEAKVITVDEIVLSDKDQADETLKKVRTEGTDFMTVAKEVSEDQEIEKKISRGMRSEEYEQAAYALASGEISDVIGADGKYYILRCVSDYDEAATKIRKEEMVREKKNEAFYETYSEYAAKVHLAKDDSLWKNLSITDGEKTSADFFEIFETVCKETE